MDKRKREDRLQAVEGIIKQLQAAVELESRLETDLVVFTLRQISHFILLGFINACCKFINSNERLQQRNPVLCFSLPRVISFVTICACITFSVLIICSELYFFLGNS
jgi:hypothetical protein